MLITASSGCTSGGETGSKQLVCESIISSGWLCRRSGTLKCSLLKFALMWSEVLLKSLACWHIGQTLLEKD